MGCCVAASPLAPPAIRHHCRRRGSGGETRQLRGGPVATDRPRAGPGPAGVVPPLEAGSSAVTYWVDEPEGFRVVTTVDTVQPGGADRHAVVRSSIVLRPGQTQTISLPGPLGSASPGLEVRRLGDRVEVRAAGPAALAD